MELQLNHLTLGWWLMAPILALLFAVLVTSAGYFTAGLTWLSLSLLPVCVRVLPGDYWAVVPLMTFLYGVISAFIAKTPNYLWIYLVVSLVLLVVRFAS